jgi:hypothetical protein
MPPEAKGHQLAHSPSICEGFWGFCVVPKDMDICSVNDGLRTSPMCSSIEWFLIKPSMVTKRTHSCLRGSVRRDVMDALYAVDANPNGLQSPKESEPRLKTRDYQLANKQQLANQQQLAN